jgi:hypothetical protein
MAMTTMMISEQAGISVIAEAVQQGRRTLDVSEEESERYRCYRCQSLNDGRPGHS